jgi:hypothetical protein
VEVKLSLRRKIYKITGAQRSSQGESTSQEMLLGALSCKIIPQFIPGQAIAKLSLGF